MKKVYLLTLFVIAIANSMAFAQLPQEHQYQIVLRNYIASLEEDDFKIKLKPLTLNPSYFSSAEDMYKTWLFFGYNQREMADTRGLRVDGYYFTLDAIESGGQVNMTVGKSQFINVITTAFYADWNYEGNPHYDSRAVKLRAVVAAAVDMMMQDQDHANGNNRRYDFLGMQLIRWAYAYGVAKDVMPASAQDAYEKGLIRMFEKLEQWGPTGIHADMDMGATVGVLYAAKFIESRNITERAYDEIDRLLDSFLHNAGYIDHGGAYDGGYNGISSFFMNWAAQISDYAPLIQALQKMSKFKAYLTLPDPDGFWTSPFHSNPSSPDPATRDYWGPYWRDVGLAYYSDDAVYLALRGEHRGIHSTSIMMEHMAAEIQAFHDDRNENKGHFISSSNDSPDEWEHVHWMDTDNYLNATALYYKSGLYDKLSTLQNSNSPFIKPPFSRDIEFTESFDDKWLSIKRQTYGTIIFNDRLSWWTREGATKGLNGFGGGNISAFWTPSTGTVILGGTRTDHNGGLDLEDWRIWPVHAISGESRNGNAFSSALQRYPDAIYELDRNIPRVTLTGDLASIYSDPTDVLQGSAAYKRVFEIHDNGLRVTSSVIAGCTETVENLFEVIPIYRWMRHSSRTQIDFEIDGNWQEPSTTFQQVSRIKLSRFDGEVLIEFNEPARVKLSPREFYQKPDKPAGKKRRMKARNIMVDLLDNGGQPASLCNSSVTYFIRSSEAPPYDGSEVNSTDTTPPEIEISISPSQPDSTQNITVQASAGDAAGIKQMLLYFDDEQVKTCKKTDRCSVDVGSYPDGTYSYYATATDEIGNKAKTSNHDMEVKTEDTTPPELKISHSPTNPDNTQQVTFIATASDKSGIKRMQIFVDDEEIKTCAEVEKCNAVLGPYNDGTYRYYATATDRDGNKKTLETRKVTVSTDTNNDTTPPDVAISHSPTSPDHTEQVTFTATASDASGIGKLSIYVNGELEKRCNESSACRIKLGPFNAGEYIYRAEATDASTRSNKDSSKEKTFEVTQKPPPNNPPNIETVTLGKKTDFLKADVEGISDPEGDPVTLVYDWRLNGESIAVVNLPFDVNLASGTKKKLQNYTTYQNLIIAGNENSKPGWIHKGKKGGALVFDGKDDYVKISSGNSLENLQKLTVSVWIKHDNWGEKNAAIISKPFTQGSWGDPWAVFKLSRHSTTNKLNMQITVGEDEAVSVQSKQDIPANKWTHITATYDGKDLILYINGSLDNSLTVNKPLVTQTNTDIFIGKKANTAANSEHYKGVIDEMRVLNVALTQEQIKYHYLNTDDEFYLSKLKDGRRWKVAVTANDGQEYAGNPAVSNVITIFVDDEVSKLLSNESLLAQNYPNPFSEQTIIQYKLGESQQIALKVYDSTGKLIETLYEGNRSAGSYTETFKGDNLASGVYLFVLIAEEETIARKMTLIN